MGSEKGTTLTKKKGFFGSIFMYADGIDKLLMTLGFMGAVGDGALMPTMMVVTSKLMNNIGSQTTSLTPDFHRKFNKTVLILCYMAAGQWIAGFVEGYCWTRTAERQTSTLRARYLKSVLRQEIGYFDLNVTSTSEVISSVSSDTLVIQDAISEKVPDFLRSISAVVAAYVAAFVLMWRLAIVGFPFVVFLVVPGLIYGRALMSIARKIKKEYNKAGIIVEQAISSVRTVYSFVGENKTMAEYSRILQGSLELGLKQGLVKGLATGTSVVLLIWSFMSYYGSRLVMYHGAKGGTVFIVVIILSMGGMTLGSAISNLKYFSEASAAGERIMEIIQRVPKIDLDNLEGQILGKVSGNLEYKHVEFAYPSRPESIILKDLNLKVPAGRTIALVGGSGSGKSTIIVLLQRFYDPQGGEILLDGVNIDKLQLKWLRSQIGLVSQEPSLFATTIKENILFGKEDASVEEVIEAAKAANAHNFICQLPQGYDTQVGEGGIQMSGGQKQRIAIARAIIKAPKILLLDEATSALDAESERVVQEALDKATVGRTTIVIAHRLSTVWNADLIGVVKNGQVMEMGSHDELIEDENSLYTSLIRLQQMEKSNELANNNTNTITVPAATILHSDIHSSSSPRLSILSRSNSANSAASSHRSAENATTLGYQVFPAPSFKRLLAMNFPDWRQAMSGCLSAVLSGAIRTTFAFSMGSTISVYFLPDHDEIKRKIKTYAFTFVGLAVALLLISIYQYYNFAAIGEYLTKRIQEKMLSKILTFEIGWFDQAENSTGAICSKLAKDANVVRSLVADRMALLVQTISTVISACILSLVIAWKLALVMIAVLPLLVTCFYSKLVLLKIMTKKAIKSQEISSKIAAEAVSNLRTVTAFSSQSRILQLLEDAQRGPRQESIRQSWLAGVVLGTSNGLLLLTWALNYWYGGKLIAHGYLRAKAFFQTYTVLATTVMIISEIGSIINDLAKGSDTVGSIFAVLDRYSLIEPEDSKGSKADKVTGHVELEDVDFAYPSRPDLIMLRGFSLKIEAGKSLALVGQSGSGKSTIIGLIERFYDPLRGMVKIDGRDIKSFHLRSLRKHIALVNQEPMLFADTIRKNITYGASEEVDDSEIIEAAKLANAHDFIAGLKDGYQTWCGDKGLQLSGGQKQRIAIARAILKNPAILLLDEATSALDSQSEKIVQEALERVMVGRTSVVVAHRLSTIQGCDMIAVLDKGKVVEKGTHSSLLAKGPNGAYYSLVSLQMTPTATNTIS